MVIKMLVKFNQSEKKPQKLLSKNPKKINQNPNSQTLETHRNITMSIANENEKDSKMQLNEMEMKMK